MTIAEIFTWLWQTILGEIVIVALGVGFALLVKQRIDKSRFGGWRVIVSRDNEEVVNREISYRKAEAVLDEPVDLSVFLKGVVSPYAWLNCDIVAEGQEIGLLKIDHDAKKFVIDLDKNPPRDPGRSTPESS